MGTIPNRTFSVPEHIDFTLCVCRAFCQFASGVRVAGPLDTSTSMPVPETGNRLLDSIPSDERSRLLARMREITFDHKDTVYHVGGAIDFVYFPRSGVLSTVVLLSDGRTAEAVALGKWGMAGLTAYLGARRSNELVVCQVPVAHCWKWSASEFAAEVAKPGAFQDVIYAHTRGLLSAVARTTACNCLHNVAERCARWLLTCHDQMEADQFTLTHEFLATMLGTRRASVTITASALQAAGLITYRRGKVKIVDRARLEAASCECYRTIRACFVP